MRGSPLTSGPIDELERTLATVFKAKQAIAVSSGTAALHATLAGLGIGAGDEVIVPAISVVMSVVPALYLGAIPVVVDTAPDSIEFDYAALEKAISERTKAIVPVHLWGRAHNMERLCDFAKSHQIQVVEDACQAHGSLWADKALGTWGKAGCFSMREGKVISTGEGGFILTDDEDFALACRSFRSHWFEPSSPATSYRRLGFNYRLSELQATAGLRALSMLEGSINARKRQVEDIFQRTDGLERLAYKQSDRESPNHYGMVLLLPNHARSVGAKLSELQVRNSIGDFGLKPVHEWPVVSDYLHAAGQRVAATPNAESFLDRTVAVVLSPHYSESEVDRLAGILHAELLARGV